MNSSRANIIGWPEVLGKNATKTWCVALGLSARWPWVGDVFSDDGEYQAALYACYVTLSLVEYVERVRSKFETPEDPVEAHWPDVPVFFEMIDDEIKRRGYPLILSEKDAVRSWLSETKVDVSQLRQLWPRWIKARMAV